MSISITNITNTSFTVNWTAHSGSVAHYNIEVYYANTSTLVKSAYNIGSGVRSYGILGLSSCTLYDIKLYSKTSRGSTNYVEWYYGASTACPTPSGVGTININSATTSGFSISWSPASYANRYCVEVYLGSTTGGTVVHSNYSIYSTSYSISGLSSGTTYTIKVWAKNIQDANGTPSTHTSETVCATPTWEEYYPDPANPQTRVWLNWTAVTGASYYEVYNVTLGQTQTTTNSYLYWSNLSANTTYQFRVRAVNTWYGSYSTTISVTTAKYPPSGVGTITVGTVTHNSVQLSWSAASGADYYVVDYKPSVSDTWINAVFSHTSTTYTVTGLSGYTTYDFKVYARNSGGNGTPSYIYGIRTKDIVPPTITNLTFDGDGRVYVSWNASDAGAGLRTTNTFALAISPPNVESYTHITYITDTDGSAYYSFTTDANGNEFVNGARYYIRVTAYDNENNQASAYVNGVYTRTRPPNWEWWTSKVAGQNIDIKAAEWNSFCKKIDQFRQYKNLQNYNFTTVSAGQTITASIVNEARNAIYDLRQWINTSQYPIPAPVSSGQTITAKFFNDLRNCLNSIP